MCAPDPILNPVTRTLWSDQCLDAVACEGSMIRPTWMPCIVCACKGCIATWYRRYCSSSCITWIDIKQTGNFKEKSKNSKFKKTLGVPTEAGRKVPFSRQPLRNCLIFFCVFFVRKDSVPSLLLVVVCRARGERTESLAAEHDHHHHPVVSSLRLRVS